MGRTDFAALEDRAHGARPAAFTRNSQQPGILVLVTFGSFFGSCVAILGPGLVVELRDQKGQRRPESKEREHCRKIAFDFFLTPRSPKAHPILTLELAQIRRAENPSFRLCAHHATLPENSRGATAG